MYKSSGEKEKKNLVWVRQFRWFVCKGTQKTTRCLKTTAFSIWPRPLPPVDFFYFIFSCSNSTGVLSPPCPFPPAVLLPSLPPSSSGPSPVGLSHVCSLEIKKNQQKLHRGKKRSNCFASLLTSCVKSPSSVKQQFLLLFFSFSDSCSDWLYVQAN